MNLVILILGNILICLLILSIKKDFLHPGFLYCIPWIVFLTFLSLSNFDYDGFSFCYIYFLIGTIMFQLGCFFGEKKISRKERLKNREDQVYYVNYQMLKIFILIEGFFVLFVLYNYLIVIRSNFNVNIFLSYYLNRDKLNNATLIEYGRNFVSAFGICLIIGYSHVRAEEQQKYKKYMILQIVLYFFLTLTRITRNGILFAALPIFMAIIVVTKQNNIQVLKKMSIAVTAFLALFGIVAVMKFYTEFESGNFFSTLFEHLLLYGSGAFVAFQKKYDIMFFAGNGGTNTFRFFVAVIDKIMGTEFAKPLVMDYTSIGHNIVTNVYTFYRWYADDFGTIYALFMQFVVGIIHGISYRKMSQMKFLGIYAYCLSIYPLVMQIFQDQYFSLLSSWVQFFIFGFIFLRTNILFSRSQNRKELRLYLKR